MTSNHHAPYVQGYTHATMVGTEGSNRVIWSKSLKTSPSTDRGLKPTLVKMELLVNAGQLHCVEYVPGPCTHRPSHHPSWMHPKIQNPTVRRAVLKVCSIRRVKS